MHSGGSLPTFSRNPMTSSSGLKNMQCKQAVGLLLRIPFACHMLSEAFKEILLLISTTDCNI
jgi:hypothetical protein